MDQVDNTEVPLLTAIVLNLPGSTFTVSTIGDTEVPIIQQWLLTIANNPGSTWILATGFWNDSGTWDDTAVWID